MCGNEQLEVRIMKRDTAAAKTCSPHAILEGSDLDGYQILENRNIMVFDQDTHRLSFAYFPACAELAEVAETRKNFFSLLGKATYHIKRHACYQEGTCVGMNCVLLLPFSLLSLISSLSLILSFCLLLTCHFILVGIGWQGGYDAGVSYGLYAKKKGTTEQDYTDFTALGIDLIQAQQRVMEHQLRTRLSPVRLSLRNTNSQPF